MAAIYLDYDQEALDRQLNLRARWPEHEAYFARWARESGAVREERNCRCDLPYGMGAAQRLDLFLPVSGSGLAPLLVFIHGGYWQSLDKGDFSFVAPAFLDRGLAVASLNYSLAPGARITEMVAEVRRALCWLGDHAADFGIDASAVVVAGHSAGGHLATMAGLTDWSDLGRSQPPLTAVASISGLYDLEAARLSYHNAVLNLSENEARRESPVHALRPVPLRLLLAVGADETDEFLRQQRLFASMVGETGTSIDALELPSQHHFSIVDALATPDNDLFSSVMALFEGEMRASRPDGGPRASP
jgi:arylformamidase